MKKVAILTNFSDVLQAYSLCIIVERQIKMLCDNGYNIKVTVMDGFKPSGEFTRPEVELCYTPHVGVSNVWEKDSYFDDDVKALHEKFSEHFKDVDVVLTHDLIYQASCWKQLEACQQVAKEYQDIRWLHWVHSATPSRVPETPFPNSLIVYPNSFDIPRVARAYHVNEDEVKHVPHPMDYTTYYGMHPMSDKIMRDHDILNADIVCTYPLRLDRGKQAEACVKTMIQLKEFFKRSVRLVFMDFHSTGGDKVKYREELKELAYTNGLNDNELIFTSEQGDETKLECPREMVRDFMLASNVFILPSRSETFSLVALEAMATGCFPVLNYDFPPMRSIYGDKPLYRKFSSNIDVNTGMDGETITEYGDEQAYYRGIAGYLLYQLENDRVMALRTKMRQDYNLQKVFRKYLEPLIYWDAK